jgi:hypothetical protein
MFFDGFEAPTIDPFWTVHVLSGTHSVVPSTERSFQGSQSAKFTTVQVSGEKQVALLHDFAQPIYGDASVCVYDTGADVSSSNAIQFILSNSQDNSEVRIGTLDYDLGPTNGGNYYIYPAGAPVNSGKDRTQDWHEWTIRTLPNLLQFIIDGEVVHTAAGPGPRFDRIGLWMYGPQLRPPTTAYFDNFSVIEVPEPSTWIVGLLGVTALPITFRRRDVEGIAARSAAYRCYRPLL